ncbi:MAG: DUF2007 domain-containing protein [Proteobacteria bacterium]|nr:DUF2007 domain-containing protein [Pseudomonadota bacterium]
MKRVYSSEDSMMAGHIKSILEAEGIPCLLKNQILSSAIGELPPHECWPETWVSNDQDYERATKIVTSVLSPAQHSSSPWHCDCGEEIEGQFTACWQCGHQRPDD